MWVTRGERCSTAAGPAPPPWCHRHLPLPASPPGQLPRPSLITSVPLTTAPAGPAVSVSAVLYIHPSVQGKIKGSYTASKMLEFSVRGTLSSAQLVLGIDKDLPYTARQVSHNVGQGATLGGEYCTAPTSHRTRAGRLPRATLRASHKVSPASAVHLTRCRLSRQCCQQPHMCCRRPPPSLPPKHRTWASTAAWMLC